MIETSAKSLSRSGRGYQWAVEPRCVREDSVDVVGIEEWGSCQKL